MQVYFTEQIGNTSASTTIIPTTNSGLVTVPIVPQRFNSISNPTHYSLVHPELNSISAPKRIAEEEARLLSFGR